MKNTFTLAWLKAAGVRAIKTMAQTMIGMITVGAAINDIKWGYVLSVALVAGLVSLLTSIGGLPEVTTPDTEVTFTAPVEKSIELPKEATPITPPVDKPVEVPTETDKK